MNLTLIFHDAKTDPPKENGYKNRLCQFEDGLWAIISLYYDGWNCTLNSDGSIDRTNEMCDIVKWADLPKEDK